MTIGTDERREAALILSGGLSLGAYQAGAMAALFDSARIDVTTVAGASIGAIHAAIVAGSQPSERARKLRDFWRDRAVEAVPQAWVDPLRFAAQGAGRHARNWINIGAARMGGAPGIFTPVTGAHAGGVPTLYDTSPLERTLTSAVDFDRLNDGTMRCCVAATDLDAASRSFSTRRRAHGSAWRRCAPAAG